MADKTKGNRSLPPRLCNKTEDNGYYYVLFSQNGRSRKQSLRTKDRQEAEVRFLGWLEQRQKDIISMTTSDPTIESCIEFWLEQQVIRLTPGIQTRYKSLVKNLLAYFGQKTVGEIQRQDSQKYFLLRQNGSIGKTKATNSTIQLELGVLRTLLNFMVRKVEPRQRRIDAKLLPYIELPEPSLPRDRVITKEEEKKYLDFAMNGNYNGVGVRPSNRVHRMQIFLVLAIETAARKSAILNLKWSMIDFTKGLINFLPDTEHQSHKRRPTIPMSDLLINFMKRVYEEKVNDYVLTKTTDVKSGLDRINKLLGIKGVIPHTFRHTWATRAAEDGVSMKVIADFMGDTEKTVRENYLHLSPDYLRSAINRQK